MPEEEPSEGFTVRDRRRFTGDAPAETAPPQSAPDSAAAAPPVAAPPIAEPPAPFSEETDEAFGEGEGEYDPNELPDVYMLLSTYFAQLRGLAWIRMGLMPNPATNQIERDMAQARVAIDTATFVGRELEAVVAPEELAPLRAMVSDLQVNFVEQSKRLS